MSNIHTKVVLDKDLQPSVAGIEANVAGNELYVSAMQVQELRNIRKELERLTSYQSAVVQLTGEIVLALRDIALAAKGREVEEDI